MNLQGAQKASSTQLYLRVIPRLLTAKAGSEAAKTPPAQSAAQTGPPRRSQSNRMES